MGHTFFVDLAALTAAKATKNEAGFYAASAGRAGSAFTGMVGSWEIASRAAIICGEKKCRIDLMSPSSASTGGATVTQLSSVL